MGVQAFDFAEADDERRSFLQRGAIEFHDAGAALELINGKTGEGFPGISSQSIGKPDANAGLEFLPARTPASCPLVYIQSLLRFKSSL